jgi:hypothetical protein
MVLHPCDWKSQYSMMVTGASAGPKERSASLTGGNNDAEPGADVGSAEMAAQLIAGVGVSGMTGFSKTTVGVDGVSVFDAQALSMKIVAMDNNN